MLNAVEPGDEILTVGGIYGIVQELEDEEEGGDLVVEIAEGIHVRVARRAVADRRQARRRGGRRGRRRRGRRRGRRRRRTTTSSSARRPSSSRSPADAAPPGEAEVNGRRGIRKPGRLPSERSGIRPQLAFPPHMTRRAATVVVVLVVAALVGVALMAIPSSPIHKKATLGLDLQGGLEVTLQAVPPKDRQLTKADLDRSVTIMRDRVDRLGVSEPEIRKQGDDQIAIQLPGVKDPAAAAEIIGKTAQLELYDLEASLVPPSIDAERLPDRAAPRSTRSSRASRRSPRRGHPTSTGCSTRRRSSSPARSRPRRRRCASTTASCPTATGCSRAARHRRDLVRRAPTASALASGRRRPRRRTTCSSYDPPKIPRDDRCRPEALGHAAGLRHADRTSRS